MDAISDDAKLPRNQMRRRIAPGIWEDMEGNPHISVTELLDMVGLPNTPENCAAAMKSLGDLDEIRARAGIKGAIRAVLTCPLFFAGVSFLALAFFSLLFALNHLNLSLVAPASASLTLVTNAVAGKILLKENVDRRRWTAAVLVCIGVYFLAH